MSSGSWLSLGGGGGLFLGHSIVLTKPFTQLCASCHDARGCAWILRAVCSVPQGGVRTRFGSGELAGRTSLNKRPQFLRIRK